MTAIAALPRAMFGAGFNPPHARLQPLKCAQMRGSRWAIGVTCCNQMKSSDFLGEFHTGNRTNCPDKRRADLIVFFKLDLGHAPVITNR